MGVSPGRIAYLDLLKVTASFCVVLIHVCARAFPHFDLASVSWVLVDVIDSLCRWCVPVFLMISGALLLEPAHEVSISNVWLRRVARYVALYVVFSLAYAVRHVGEFGWDGWRSFIGLVVRGEYHLWYLPMAATVAVLLPALRVVASDERVLRYSCVLFFLGSCLASLPLLDDLTALGVSDLLTDLNLVVPYAGYCLLGRFAATYQGVRDPRRLAAIFALSVGLTAFGTFRLSVLAGYGSYELYDYLRPNVLLASLAAFLLCRSYSAQLQSKLGGRLGSVANCSLGVYLVHPMLIFAVQDLCLDMISQTGAVLVIAWSIVIWAVSLGIVACFRRLRIIGSH